MDGQRWQKPYQVKHHRGSLCTVLSAAHRSCRSQCLQTFGQADGRTDREDWSLTKSNTTGVVSAQSCLPPTEAVGLNASRRLDRQMDGQRWQKPYQVKHHRGSLCTVLSAAHRSCRSQCLQTFGQTDGRTDREDWSLTKSNTTGVVSAQSCLPPTEAVGLNASRRLDRQMDRQTEGIHWSLTKSNTTGVVSAQSCLPPTEAVGLNASRRLDRQMDGQRWQKPYQVKHHRGSLCTVLPAAHWSCRSQCLQTFGQTDGRTERTEALPSQTPQG